MFVTFNDALAKGYPEYREDQPRGEDGRWGGGGSMGARAPRKPATTASSGKKPRTVNPANAERNARARQRYASKPRVPAAQRRAKEQAQRELEQARSKKLGELIDRMYDVKPGSAEDKQIARDALDMRDKMKTWSGNTWYDPTVADHFMKFLTQFDTAVGALLLGGVTGGVATSMYGSALAVTGVYLALRYAYRKIRTLGGYRGVRWPEKDDFIRREYGV